ncbi:MAG: MFS transporter [Planctomycetaceae bacterium]|jgi:sugar phosphate permease|nr:MFS transporter [Planctomycetaceae bacterium]
MQNDKQSTIPKLYKWELLVLLWTAYFLNQGDRQIFSAVLPLIKEDMGFSDVQLGLVATIFTVCYGLFVPLSGFAGDLFKRRSVVFVSLLVFSCGTLITGWATGLIMLIVFRSITTGVGEAFYYPSANSLIGQYHHRTRATAMAIHQTSVYTGIVCGGVLAAWIGTNFGWRSSFYFFGTLGLVWSFVVLFRLRNDRKDAASTAETVSATKNAADVEKVPLREILRKTLGKPTLYFLSLAFGGHVFVNVGFLTWMPTFLYEKFDISLTRANFDAMFYHHAFAYLGVLAAAALSDYLARSRKTIRMEIESIGMLLATPFIFLMGWSDNLWVVYLALCGFGIFRGVYDSNLFVALFDVIEPKYRSTATGLMLSFAFVIGAFSPVALGWVKQNIGLEQGMMGLAIVYFLSSVTIFIGLKTCFKKDFYVEDNQ